MSFPLSPTNGQQASINGVTYVYSSALTAWTVSTGFGDTFLNISVTDTVNSGNLAVTGLASVTGNITGGNFIGNGSQLTGIPISTGVSGLGAGVATFLATPSSANLAAAVTGETGTGALVFGTTPTLTTPVIGAATGTSLVVTAGVTGSVVTASNGLMVNSNTVAASYSIPSGSSAMSAGPMSVSGGVVVTVPSGSRWVVL